MGRRVDRIAGSLVRLALSRGLREGRLTVREGHGPERSFGPADSELRGSVTINDPRAWGLLARGTVGLGEGYIDQHWHADDLLSVLRIGARELNRRADLRIRLHWPRSLTHRLRGLVPRNTRRGARQNISAHYDLGNDLFEAFLDQRMQYSCAVFENGADFQSAISSGSEDRSGASDPDTGDGLEQAQLVKLNRICEALDLGPGDHLLEIGTGWGGLAVHAAGEYQSHVTTTTISRRQYDLARRRIDERGLGDRIELLERDYRDLEGRFDKLVSIEMIEAVGWQYFDLFFQRCADLLRSGGRMFLQAITVPDRLYETEKATRTFANTHVFPGGCLPSEAVIIDCAKRAGLRPLQLRRIGTSYAPTLAAWRQRFLAAWRAGRLPRYDERFKRLWEFYLTYCEAGFLEGTVDDVQVLFEKSPVNRTNALPAQALAET